MQDVINDIKVIEEDLENVEKKCENVNCGLCMMLLLRQ